MESFRKIVKESGESDLDGSYPDLVVKSKIPKLGRLQSIYTYNRIDSLTEGFDNPLESTLANPKRMGHHLNAIDKTENLVPAYVPPTLENFDEMEEEEEEEDQLSKLNLRRGIMELIIEKLVESGRFKFRICRDKGIPMTVPKLTKNIAKMKKWARGVIVCRRLKVVARQASVRMQNKKKGEKVFNSFTLPVYHERIKTISVEMMKLLHNQDSFFDTYIQNESTAVHFADILDHTMTLCTSNLLG
jgi:hypothetical protein